MTIHRPSLSVARTLPTGLFHTGPFRSGLVRAVLIPVRLAAIVMGCSLPGLAAAAAVVPTPAPPPDTTFSVVGEMLGIVLPVALLIIALFAVLYFVRRRFGLSGKDAPLTILQILPVGPRERIVLVKSRGGRLFAVGVSGQSVTLITNMERSDLESADAQSVAAHDDSDTGDGR